MSANKQFSSESTNPQRLTLRAYWDSVSGRAVSAWEAQLLNDWLADAFGYYAIQLGQNGRIAALAGNRCSERYAIERGYAHTQPSQPDEHGVRRLDVADFSVLPFSSDSLDWVILPHTLDEHPDPHGVLREAYRVLRAEGRMIILGFNPLSLWGMQAKFHRWFGCDEQRFGVYRHIPHSPLHISRLKDWIELLNCDVMQGKYGCYTPYVTQEKWLQRTQWLEKAGDRWWGFGGAVYALLVVKRVYSPTLVGLIDEKKTMKPWRVQPAVRVETPNASRVVTTTSHELNIEK